jgi:heme oxygenase (mycobilin-producing)
MNAETLVLIYHATDDVDGVLAAYHEVSAEMSGVPGMLGNELLRSVVDPLGFVVASRWVDIDAFNTWEQGPEHKDTTSALRRYRDTRMERPFGVYQVTASYGAPAGSARVP